MPDAIDEPRSPAAIYAAHCREGRLAYPAAPDGTPVWPPSLVVPGTGEPVQWLLSEGRGTVYSTTALRARDSEPRNVAIVELDECYRMMARVDGLPADAVEIGARVRVRFGAPDEAGARLPFFVPQAGA
ncbi:MAG TPA: OB-fold domain-containing protein [Solirubrobacteraceae bacterium]